MLPTLAELTNAKLPPNVRLDGRSFASLLSNERGARHPKRDWIFSQYREARVIRDKRFKLYSSGELYDLMADPFEEADIAKSVNAEAMRAKAKLERILKSFPADPVLPSRNADGDGDDGE